jgi:hypothetical protein
MTSGPPCEADEIFVLLGYYEVYSGNSLPTFRDKLSGSNSQRKSNKL